MSNSSASDSSRVMHVAVLSVFTFFAIVAVIFRLWARRVQRAKLELSDYFCLLGFIFTLALVAFTIHAQLFWNLGKKPGNPDAVLALVILSTKAVIVGQIVWIASVFFIRASVVQLYITLFRRTKSFRITCYVVHILNFGYFASTVLAACLICRPIAFHWDHKIPGGICGNQKSLDLFIGIFNLFLDVAVVVLPMPVLWGLQMATQKKAAISAMFGMGIIICIITLIRIWVTSLIRGESNAQEIYTLLALLTGLESLFGVVNACLPVMKPVFTKFWDTSIGTFFSRTLSTISSSTYGRSARGGTDLSANHSSPRKNYKTKNGAFTGIFGTNKTTQAWPSAVSTTPGSSEMNMHRYVDNKAAQLMFSHTTTSASTSKLGNQSEGLANPPRPPPKSKYYSPDKMLGEKGELEITVRRDWDIERGERAPSDDSNRELLEDGKSPRPQ